MKNLLPVFLLMSALGACEAADNRTPDRTFTEEERRLLLLANGLNRLNVSPLDTLPTQGSASYFGKVGMFDDGYSLIGDLRLDVNFSSESIQGNASRFVDSGEQLFSGALEVNNGRFDRQADPETEYQFSATMNGVLTSRTGSALFETTLDGDFLGQNQEGVDGVVSGTVATVPGSGFDGLISGGQTGLVSGEFGANRR